jgi:hypothetical protein
VVLAILAGGAGTAWPARPEAPGERLPSARPFVLVDAAGRLVGRVVGSGQLADGLLVWVRRGGRDVLLTASRDLLAPALAVLPFVAVAFESTDCTGPAWLYVSPSLPPLPPGLFPVAAQGPGRGVFVGDGAPVAKTLASVWLTSSDPPCTPVPPSLEPVRPAVQALDLDDWPAPFTLR